MGAIKILATGAYAPEHTLDNDQLSQMVDTSDEWIFSRTGMKVRHISQGENTSDLGVKAARIAIQNSGIAPEKIGLLLVSTFTPDCYTPATACIIQEKLGLAQVPMMAFDISAACSGFPYALKIANALLKETPGQYGLIVSSEVISKVVDYTDRSTCILFGDAAGAVVVQYDENAMLYTCAHSRADKETLYVPGVDMQDQTSPSYIYMNGREVFKFAVETVPQAIDEVLKQAGLTIDGIDYIVLHQANARIIASIQKRLGCKSEKLYMNIAEYANTSSASIPVALDEMVHKGMLKKGMKVVCVGFGAGLTWGAALLEW